MPMTRPPFVEDPASNCDPAPQTTPVLKEAPLPKEMVPSANTVAPLLTIIRQPGDVAVVRELPSPISRSWLAVVVLTDKRLLVPETSTRLFEKVCNGLSALPGLINSLPPLVMISWLNWPLPGPRTKNVPDSPTAFVTTPGPLMMNVPTDAAPARPTDVRAPRATVPLVTANTPKEFVLLLATSNSPRLLPMASVPPDQ